MDTWYITIGGQEIETRPAAGRMRDADWGGRESRAVTIEKSAVADPLALFCDGAVWGMIHRYTTAVPVLDAEGNIQMNEDGTVKSTTETAEDRYMDEYADFTIAGPITDNRDGTITVKMGKPMPLERAEAEKAAAQHTAATLMGMPVYTAIGEERAKDLRYAIETAAASLDDKTASEAPELFPQLTGDGSLVKSGTRICWQGSIKRAAVDLWDTAENTPDAAKNLWEDIQYKQGYRLIPETITAGLAFFKGEKGWWQDELYESLLAANVWNQSVNPDGWKKITEEGT